MDELLSEKEQIEQMRAWWSDYGWYVIGGVVIGAAILFGFNRYDASKIATEEAASARYDAVMQAISDADIEASETAMVELATAHGNSIYAAQSKLAMARLYMDQNRDQDAAEALQSLVAMDGFDNPEARWSRAAGENPVVPGQTRRGHCITGWSGQ